MLFDARDHSYVTAEGGVARTGLPPLNADRRNKR